LSDRADVLAISEAELERKLLVKAALEAVLTKSPQRPDPERRDQKLKAAALLACAEKGYVNLTIADIARRSKISTSTIYAAYRDREALLVAAMEMLLTILGEDVIEAPPIDDPMDKVQVLLLAHGLVYAEPFATWLFRLYISLTWFENPQLRAIGARVFRRIDAYWETLIEELIAAGHLIASDPKIVAPLILGPIERWTIISRLGCGEHDRDDAPLTAVARYSAESLFALWGSESFWAARGVAAPPRMAPGVAAAPQLVAPPASDLAARLAESLHHGADPSVAQRRHRIMLAAAVECRERGYNLASVTEVATRAEVSVATLYKHFRDKAGLYAEVLAFEAATDEPAPTDLAYDLWRHARRATAPDRAWILNLSMASELSAEPSTIATNLGMRTKIEAAWAERLSNDHAGPARNAQETALAVNFLLGGIERSSIFCRLLFGPDGVDATHLAELARTAAAASLHLRRRETV
jgi:AcrR family transcriptional regulator